MWREVTLGLSVETGYLGVECGQTGYLGVEWREVTLGLSVERGYLGAECGPDGFRAAIFLPLPELLDEEHAHGVRLGEDIQVRQVCTRHQQLHTAP